LDYEAVPIITMREGEEGVVESVSGGERLSSRLASMGLLPGIKVKVLRNAGGSVILLASDTRMALGRGIEDKC
jgi:Fe2+ transport system protein FeoA